MSNKISRREALIGLGAAAATLAGADKALAQIKKNNKRKRVLRIAHLTDVHVQPEKKADEWLAKCLRHVQSQKDKPNLILNGGDTIMDSFGADQARTKTQWDVWNRVLKSDCSLPVENCIGNHDVWGWNKQSSKTTGDEPLYGKKWAMEMFGVSERYRSFDKAGWHFIVLDSTFADGGGYKARLDDPQFEWLKEDLAKTPKEKPTLVLSHIPILCGCAFLDGNNEKTGDWVVPGSWMHIDARRILEAFYQHKNVKLCLSGHIHLQDRLDYNGVTYLCNGAVSGAWWGGNYHQTPPGYALVDLYDDGSFEHEYVTYGWKG